MRAHLTTVAAMAAIVLAASLAGCSRSDDVAQANKAPAGPRITLAMSDTSKWQDVSAEIATVDQAQILARIPGILTSLTVKEGDVVEKGQIIGRIVDSQLGYQAGAYGAQAAAAKTAGAKATAAEATTATEEPVEPPTSEE